VRTDATGQYGPTPRQARNKQWRQTTHGFHVPAGISDELPEQRILEESMRLPDDGCVTGWAGCRLAQAAFFDGLAADGASRLAVPLLVPTTSRLRSLDGSTVSREPFSPDEVRRVAGIATASPVRALFDEMRRVDPREAVVALDMMAAALAVSVSELRDYLAPRRSWNRATRVTWAIEHADECSRSPNETRTRLVWRIDAGLPKPFVNQLVWDGNGRLLGEADLFDPEAGMVVEYDGGTHLRFGQRTRDNSREVGFRRAGLEFLRVLAPDLHDRATLADRMRAARARALYARGVRGAWTLDPPPHSRHTETAADVLAHRDWLRSLHEPA
jgi:hypothetical protein